MNRERALEVANAVLYEGYMLYPYRRSALKNRQRWSFGILYPPAYHEVGAGTERSQMHSECLLKATGDVSHSFADTGRKDGAPSVHVHLRFLQLVERENGEEAVERSFECELPLRALAGQTFPFAFSGGHVGHQTGITGTVVISLIQLQNDLLKLAIDIANTSTVPGDAHDRDSALHTSLLSAHTILSVTGGEFISLLDPPNDVREDVSQCRNIGNFPVLVGNEGERSMMLCSPIVLYDYPQLAPESAGDFFDGTEMDEMLTLRVMTMTEEEKNEMRSCGDHMRELLQRTEAGAREQLMRTHGTIRSLRPVDEP